MRLLLIGLLGMTLAGCVVYNDGTNTGVLTPVGNLGGGEAEAADPDEIPEP